MIQFKSILAEMCLSDNTEVSSFVYLLFLISDRRLGNFHRETHTIK